MSAGSLLGLAVLSLDDAPLDTSALRYEPRIVPDPDNGYLVLADAAARLGEPADMERPKIMAMISGAAWDEAQVETWQRDRSFAISAITELRAFQTGQAPIPKDAEAYLAPTPNISLPGLLAALHARQLQRNGDTRKAVDIIIDCMHAASLVEQSRGSALPHVHATFIKEAALEAVVAVVSDPHTFAPDCLLLKDQTSHSRPEKNDFEQLIAADFRGKERLVQALKGSGHHLASWKPNTWDSIACRVPFLYKPNQTLNYVIPYYLGIAEEIDLSPQERKTRFGHKIGSLDFLCSQYGEKVNGYGKRLAHDYLVSPSFPALLDARLRQQTLISLAETLIALRLYHDAHGRQLPATLAELVPAYLPAVPRDYFDGTPIKYSRDLRAIWSAGPENFQLTNAEQAVHERELILPICFDGAYTPWPRRDLQAALFTDSTERITSPVRITLTRAPRSLLRH